jgi:hypothetical protein
MKKIIFSLCLLAFSVSLFGQASTYPKVGKKQNFVDSTYFTKDISTSLGNLKNLQQGVFNVLDYGAIRGDGNADQAAIQAAINAAAAYNTGVMHFGGTVVIPAGQYEITSPDTLKSYVDIQIDRGAYFHFAGGYNKSMWVVNGTMCVGAHITGGYYYGSTQTWNFIDLTATSSSNYVMSNTFRDLFAENCNIGLKLTTTTTGYVNSNVFDNVTIWGPIIYTKTRSAVLHSNIDGNIFSNNTVQSGAAMTHIIDSLDGNFNKFSNLTIWDVANDAPTAVTCEVIGYNNYIQGNDITLQGFVNTGYGNEIIDNLTVNPFHTIKKLIGVSPSGRPQVFSNHADSDAETIDLGAIIPAKARILTIDITCVEPLGGSGAHEILFNVGNTSGGSEFITSISDDDYLEVIGISDPHLPAVIVPNWASATNVYVTANPDANWSTYTDGKWNIYITYIEYSQY